MFNQQQARGQADRRAEPEPENHSVDLTNEELRSISGGRDVFLNLEIEKGPKTDRNPRHRGPHDRQ